MKKLALNRETLRDLSARRMKRANAGQTPLTFWASCGDCGTVAVVIYEANRSLQGQCTLP